MPLPNNSSMITMAKRDRIVETPNLILRAAQPSDVEALFPIFSDKQVMRYWSEPPHASINRTREWVDSMVESLQNGVTDFIITLKSASSSTTLDTAKSNSISDDTINEAKAEAEAESSNVPLATDTSKGQAQVIGKIGIYAPWPSNEIGFLLSRAFWGRGLAYEALSCMLEYIFSLPDPCYEGAEALSKSEVSQSTGSENENGERCHITNMEKEEHGEQNTKDTSQQELTTLSMQEQSNTSWRYASITTDVDPRNVACLRLLRRVGFEESGYVEKTWCVNGEWVDSVFLRLTRDEWLRRQTEEVD